MRITIIGGFLGAGKTTLLNRILASTHARDAVVLVNDFGKVSIDSRLVAARAERLITLANGCICCSIGNDFVASLIRITRRKELPRRLIVEASGVADPAPIAELAATDPAFSLEAIPVVVDASAFTAQRTDPRIGDLVERQVAAADLIVLNKLDLAGEATAAAVENWFSRHLPRRPVLRACNTDIPLGVLFDEMPPRPLRRAVGVSAEGVADAPFDSFLFEADRPFAAGRLAEAIGMLPAGILRGKGCLRLAGDDPRPKVFQMVGPRWNLVAATEDVPLDAVSELVLIGLPGSLDADWLSHLFDAALVPHPAAPATG